MNKECGSILTKRVTPEHGGRAYKVSYFTCGKCGVNRRAKSYQHARKLWGAHQSALPYLSHGYLLPGADIRAVSDIA